MTPTLPDLTLPARDLFKIDTDLHIERRSPVQLAAIGIGHDVSRFYRNATRISRIDDLGPAITAKLLSLLDE